MSKILKVLKIWKMLRKIENIKFQKIDTNRKVKIIKGNIFFLIKNNLQKKKNLMQIQIKRKQNCKKLQPSRIYQHFVLVILEKMMA